MRNDSLSDIDFPCSWDFYRYYASQYGTDPGPDEPLPVPVPMAIPPEPPWSREQWAYVQQLRAQVNYLNSKVTEMRVLKKVGKIKTSVPRFKGTI